MVLHRTVTLTGSAQNLGTVLASANKGTCKFLSIHADPGNTHVIYVGGAESTLSSSDYGFRIEAPSTSIPPAPSILELAAGLYGLGNIQVLGTNTEKLYVFAIFT